MSFKKAHHSSVLRLQVVQLLMNSGCQFAARNNEGFTANDFAYSSVPDRDHVQIHTC